MEEFEDEMISLFRRSVPDLEKHICADITSKFNLNLPISPQKCIGHDKQNC